MINGRFPSSLVQFFFVLCLILLYKIIHLHTYCNNLQLSPLLNGFSCCLWCKFRPVILAYHTHI